MSCRIAEQFALTSLTVFRYRGIDCVFAQYKGIQKHIPVLVFGFSVWLFFFLLGTPLVVEINACPIPCLVLDFPLTEDREYKC